MLLRNKLVQQLAGGPVEFLAAVTASRVLYEGTLDCLRFFYPRMVAGGVIISHDYSILTGVKRAFDEFFADKPEGVVELPTTQCMVVKLMDQQAAMRPAAT